MLRTRRDPGHDRIEGQFPSQGAAQHCLVQAVAGQILGEQGRVRVAPGDLGQGRVELRLGDDQAAGLRGAQEQILKLEGLVRLTPGLGTLIRVQGRGVTLIPLLGGAQEVIAVFRRAVWVSVHGAIPIGYSSAGSSPARVGAGAGSRAPSGTWRVFLPGK